VLDIVNTIEYPMTITGRLLPAMVTGECGGIDNINARDSLNPLGTKGTEVNNTQSQTIQKKFKAHPNSLANLIHGIKHTDETKKILSVKAKEQHQKALLDGSEIVRRKKISETMKKYAATSEFKKRSGKIAESKSKWTKEYRDAIFKNESRSEKISIGRKKFLAANPEFKESMIRRFMNAPVHKKLPNKPETNVNNLKIESLEYTGNGKYFITLNKTWKKNPDFIIQGGKRAKAVVELMDFEYWHSKNEIETLTSLYKEQKVKCLIIDAKRCYTEEDLDLVKNEIKNFIDGLK